VALACVLIGSATSVQQAFDGSMTRATGQPTPGTLVNFCGRTAVLAVLFLGTWGSLAARPSRSPVPPGGRPSAVWSAWSSSPIAAWVVPIAGVLVFAVLSVARQVSCALLLDILAPTDGTILGWHLVLGVGLAFVAVGIAARGRPVR
jgi:transporter family-2 protein